MTCFFRSQSPARMHVRDFPFTSDGFRDAVDDAKKQSTRFSTGSVDVNLVCGPKKDIFLLTCDGPKTCTTKFSGRPHGGLGSRRKKRRR